VWVRYQVTEKKKEVEEQPEGWFVKLVRARVKTNYHVPIVVVGPTGVGKTSMALVIGEEIDPTFSEDPMSRVSFGSVSGFLKKIMNLMELTEEEIQLFEDQGIEEAFKTLGPKRLEEIMNRCLGKVIVFDESGVGASDDQFMYNMNRAMRWVAQTYRIFKFVPILILPQFYRLDPGVRSQVFLVIDVKDRGFGVVYRQRVDSFNKRQSGRIIGFLGTPDHPIRQPSEKIMKSIDQMQVVEKIKILINAWKLAKKSEAKQLGKTEEEEEKQQLNAEEVLDFINEHEQEVLSSRGNPSESLIKMKLAEHGYYATQREIRYAIKLWRDNVKPTKFKASGDFRSYAVKRCKKKYGATAAQILELTLAGMRQVDIAEEVFNNPGSQPSVAKILRPIREKSIGYWYEDYMREKMGLPPRSDNEKNQPVPDLIDKEGKIYSLKCYMNKKASVSIQPIRECQPEIKEARKRGSTFILLFNNPIWNETHRVEIDPDKIPFTITFRKAKPPKITY